MKNLNTMRILQMIMDYIAGRDLTATQMVALYDCIQNAIEKFDEELLYSEYNYNADADAEYTEYSNTEYAEYYYKFL